MAAVNLTVPIEIKLPDDWKEQFIERLKENGTLVEVVRCKNCTHLRNDKCDLGHANRDSEWFCKDGDERTDEVDDVIIKYKEMIDAASDLITNAKISEVPDYNYLSPPNWRAACPNHPTNGGSGICHCVLGTQPVY